MSGSTDRDSRPKPERPRREAGVVRKHAGGGAEGNRHNPMPQEHPMTNDTLSLADERAQMLQDFMEQHYGRCLRASEWDAIVKFLDGQPRTTTLRAQPDSALVEDALELITTVREMVRAENAHARGGERSMRDDCDFALCRMLTQWPAKRLDKLKAALRSHTLAPADGEEA